MSIGYIHMNIICLHMIHMHIQMCIYNVHMHIDIKQVQHTKQGTPKSKCVHRHDRRWLHEHKLFMYLCIYIHIFITKFPRYACRSSKQLQLLRIIACICSEQRELLSCQAGPASSATSSPPSTNLASVSRELFPPVADAAPETIPAAC